jgi:hypothetical protein
MAFGKEVEPICSPWFLLFALESKISPADCSAKSVRAVHEKYSIWWQSRVKPNNPDAVAPTIIAASQAEFISTMVNFILLHESAHALINRANLSDDLSDHVAEETVADYFAVQMLKQANIFSTEARIAPKLLFAAANFAKAVNNGKSPHHIYAAISETREEAAQMSTELMVQEFRDLLENEVKLNEFLDNIDESELKKSGSTGRSLLEYVKILRDPVQRKEILAEFKRESNSGNSAEAPKADYYALSPNDLLTRSEYSTDAKSWAKAIKILFKIK